MPSKSLLVVALEASADLHGAAVLRELKALRPDVKAFGAGGPRMRAEGFEMLVRAEDLSVMGVAEVVPRLPEILEAMDALHDAVRERQPKAALLIDSPDFNLRLARRLHERKIPVAYFIGPSVWAWRTYRVKQIARDVARMLVILPFEQTFYEQHGVRATYVGNPLMAPSSGPPMKIGDGLPVLALLPGSRLQEIRRLWPAMLAAARKLREKRPDLQLVVPVAPTVDRGLLHAPDVIFVDGRAPEVLQKATAAIVASGTATLEAAIAGVPMVVVYKTSWLTWLIGRLLVRVKFISLVNLLAGRALVPELLQSGCTAETVAAATVPLLNQTPERMRQIEGLQQVRASLAGPGNPARRVAEEVAQLL